MIVPIVTLLFVGLLVLVYLDAKKTIPYVYCSAMVSAWMGKMLDCRRMLEICERTPEEIPELLKGTDFEGMEYGPPEMMELQIRERCVRRYRELLENLPPAARRFYALILERFELFNLKAVLTHVMTGAQVNLVPSPISTQERWKLLMGARSLQELVDFLKGTDYGEVLEEALRAGEDLPGIIRRLDLHYFTKLWSEARRQKRSIRDLVGVEVDIINLRTLFRLKLRGADVNEVRKALIRPSYLLSDQVLEAAALSEDPPALVQALSGTVYGEAITRAYGAVKATGSLYPLEKELEEGLLRMCRWYISADFFSLTPAVCFFYLKEAEIRNLRTVIRLRISGFKPQECKQEIVCYEL